MAKESGGIQSLERAFTILEVVARNEGIGLGDLSKAVGLHASTASHLVRTMTALGYVAQDPDSKRYRVGSRLFTLAAGALDERTLLALATPIVESLAGETGESAHFAIRSGRDVIVLARTSGAAMMQPIARPGVQRPLHATAIGKVLLSALTDAHIRQLLRVGPLHRFTARTIVRTDALLREIDGVRRSGVAYDDGEFDDEVRCVAVPVRDFAGRIAGALGISGAVWRLSLATLQTKARMVRRSALVLSAQFGYTDRKAPRIA